jgi:hypothetical protein
MSWRKLKHESLLIATFGKRIDVNVNEQATANFCCKDFTPGFSTEAATYFCHQMKV